MHGGSAGSGAPRGNQNRLVHGRYARAALERRALGRLAREAAAAVDAELRVLDVVVQGEVEQFDVVVQVADDQWVRLQQAADALAALLKAIGRSDEATDLAAEISEIQTDPATALAPDGAGA